MNFLSIKKAKINSDSGPTPEPDESREKCAEICFHSGKLIFFCFMCPPDATFSEYCELKAHLFSVHFSEYFKDDDAEIKIEDQCSPERHTSVDEDEKLEINFFNKNEIDDDVNSNLVSPEFFDEVKSESLNGEENLIQRKSRTKRRRKRDPEKPKRQGDWHRVYKILTIDGATRYQCEFGDCNKHFRTRDNLRSHERIHKGDWKPHPCEYCDRVCRNARQLRDHVRIHTGEKPYKCDCGTDLRTMSALIAHKKKHAGVKRFECQYCERRFFVKEVRNAHERTHTGEKPFVCDVCGVKFISKSILNTHRVTHFKDQTPKAFACDICTAKFHRKTLLKTHMDDVHLCEKKFICNICQSAYKRKFQLTQHLKIHDGTNEYSCNMCGQEFVKYSRVRDHLRLQHQLKAKTNYTFTPANLGKDNDIDNQNG